MSHRNVHPRSGGHGDDCPDRPHYHCPGCSEPIGPNAVACADCLAELPEWERPGPTARLAGHVIKAPGSGYFVKSRTVEGGWWFVVGEDCSCPATTERCWHYRRTVEFERTQTPPRPTAPPNISALVD